MGESTAIAWTASRNPDGSLSPGATYNLWWGCDECDPACAGCYARTMSTRFQPGHKPGTPLPVLWGKEADRLPLSDKSFNAPLLWQKKAVREGRRVRVFAMSMGDLFEGPETCQNPDAWRIINGLRERFFAEIIPQTPNLDWLLLTKRPQNIRRFVPQEWLEPFRPMASPGWPANVWAGASFGTQETLERGLPHLLLVPAAIRFLSLEPLLGPISLQKALEVAYATLELRGIDLPACSNGADFDRLAGAHNMAERSFCRAQDAERLFAGADDGKRREVSCGSASSGLPPLLRVNTERADDQSQERPERRQQPGESGTGNLLRANDPQPSNRQSGMSSGGEEPGSQTYARASAGNQEAPTGRRTVEVDSSRLRDFIPSSLEDRKRLALAIQWCIVGGESGKRARPMHPAWARHTRDDCAAANVPFFFKQWGEHVVCEIHADGSLHPPLPIHGLSGMKLWHPTSKAFLNVSPFANVADVFAPGAVVAFPMRKEQAGHLLDGQEHYAWPQTPGFLADGTRIEAQ